MDIPERDTSMAERRSRSRTFSSSEEWQQALQALNSPPQSRSISSRPEQVFHNAERYTLGNAVKDMARAFRERHMETSLKRLRASPALIFLKVWHTYGIWVGACVYFTISANLMLAWYIDWYRQSGTYRESRGASQIFHFDLAPFFAIFCRSWLLVCVVGDLLRFCYLLAKDAWEEDAFVTYRRVVCGDFQRDLQDEIEKKPLRSSQWSVEMLSSPGCRALDALLQISIYLALDVVPAACFLISYMAEESFENATVAASAGLSGGSCIHVFVFFLAMWVTDVVAKCRGFVAAYRGEARLAPCEYPGESLQNFQWAGEFGDRHLANLEAARCVSFVEDSLDGPPDRCLSPRSGGAGDGGVSLGDRSDQSPPSGAATSDVARRLGGSVHLASAGALDVQESSSSALPPRLDMLARPQRRETAGSIDTVAVADQLNLCIPMCVCFSGTLALCLPHLLWVTVVVVGWQARNWALVGAGVALMVVTVCRRQCASGGPPTGERPCFPGAGSWELWALQAWGEQYCGLHSEVQQLSTVTFAVVLLLQGILLATLGQWAGMLVCLGMVLVTFLRHRMAYRERPWGWLIGVLLGFAHGVVATVLNAGLGKRWGVMTFMFALAYQLGLSRHNPRGFNLARFTAVLLNGVLVIVVGVVVLSIATQNADSNWSAFCTEGDATCKYYEVPLYASNMSLPLECDRHFGYGKDGQHLLSVSDFALFSALAYESEDGLRKGLQRYFPGWSTITSRRAGPNATALEGETSDWTTYFEFWDPENSTIVFAIRGTNSMLDVLDDLNIWGPAAIMQAFSLAGPSLSSAVAESVALLSTVMYGESMQKQYFSDLLAHVRSRTTQLPDRRFYITGHSLGGGLAKLVAAKTHMQAVTFMAPGLGTTSYVVYREHMLEELRHISLTIMPENDVVSRVDTQTGITVKTDCDGNPLHCHQLYPTICTLLQTCGSGRAGEAALALPCGACDNMPCPSAHLRPREVS